MNLTITMSTIMLVLGIIVGFGFGYSHGNFEFLVKTYEEAKQQGYQDGVDAFCEKYPDECGTIDEIRVSDVMPTREWCSEILCVNMTKQNRTFYGINITIETSVEGKEAWFCCYPERICFWSDKDVGGGLC